MNRKATLIVLVFSLLIVGSVVAGVALDTNGDGAQGGGAPYRQMNVYQEVLQRINDDYVTSPNLQKVGAGALHGLLISLDPDSSYLSPAEYKQYLSEEQAPSKGSIGLVISKRLGYATVVDVTPQSPAAKAGLQPGDFIESIGALTTHDLSAEQIRDLINGAPGTAVELNVVTIHSTKPKKFTLTRMELPQLLVQAQMQGKDIGYIALPDLTSGRSTQVARAVRTLQAQGAKKWVIDLRNCGRGSFQEAQATASLFLSHGLIGYLEGQKFPRQNLTPNAGAQIVNGPVAVLTNVGTYGPAELLAGALKDNGRGTLVGARTFGEGALQKIIPVGDGSALLLSVADYYTPSGHRLEKKGVKPNVEQARYPGSLPDDDEELLGAPSNVDLQLQKAIQILSQGAGASTQGAAAASGSSGAGTRG